MDYLDPQKRFRHAILLMVGYVLIAIAILISTTVLLYKVYYGFSVNNNGQVIQSGLVFLSSHPAGASITLNDTLRKEKTNARLGLPAGDYNVQLKRAGYRTWQRLITLDGGRVAQFNYPLLIPSKLVSSTIASTASAPGIFSQSPDGRWLIVGRPESLISFDLYDLSNPTKQPTTLTLPTVLLSAASGAQSWQLGEWSSDNQHLLLKHLYDDKSEYIMVDRQNPDQSLNLNEQLGTSPSRLTLKDTKYDQYYVYDAQNATLGTASLGAPTITPLLTHVLNYKSYGSDEVVYVSDEQTPVTSKVAIKVLTGGTSYNIRQAATNTDYLLDVNEYKNINYVVASAVSENKAYVYQDPVNQLVNHPTRVLVPVQVLKVAAPSYVAFSPHGQFVMVENANSFGVYDADVSRGYSYSSSATLDSPQTHAYWLDSYRLSYVSQGKLVIFDYDYQNVQTLETASAEYAAVAGPNERFIFNLAPSIDTTKLDLTQTALLTKADQ